jgi:cardiolipin synthase
VTTPDDSTPARPSALERMLQEERTASEVEATSRILTIPNVISFVRIALIPVFMYLLIHEGTEYAGILLFGAVVATDWVDGTIARRTGQVSKLGRILDPVADRAALAGGLIALVIRGAFPLWAALVVIVRDVLILLAGLVLLAGKKATIDVRFIGKIATFTLMAAIPAVAWGNLGLVIAPAALALGWTWFAVGVIEYYWAAALYAGDLRRAARSAP